ncbi:response regulator [Rhizobium sp. 268]|uniref:response regulator n=2 Tax=Rhizobium/Agrobacterium group TaxID=227290 RepID=UPI000BE9DA0C|nr:MULTISPECIES: response regulator [Rhizobium]MBB3522636.1 two-component system phosphate regulon response regulator OmpR [Rhizobium sp. BK456]MBY4588039.1 response regulator [Rhizobium redzepovicii]MBY4615733.1 response regulator [Rhizobium redzepovicii]MDF0659436.1 response regulator [Rhizobium sp. BC49]MDR9784777.1 response regulator [Rhizobium redzepovicii]
MSYMEPDRILVVDDDARIRQMLVRYFEDNGYRVNAVGNGAAMRAELSKASYAAVFLDLVLPGGENGLELLKELRSTSDVPVLMLTGQDDVTDKVVGLEFGADDYVAKPFHLRELLARLRTVLRRRTPAPQPAPTPNPEEEVLRFDGWRLEVGRRRLSSPQGEDVSLTTGEFDMLLVFARNPGRVLSRDKLMDLTRSRSLEAFDRAIDAQIVRLRKKVEVDPKEPMMIQTVRGVGYVFTPRPSNER